MRWLRVLAAGVALMLAANVWCDPTVQLTVDSLTPQGPYSPGQQVRVTGSVVYTDLPRPWGGGGISTTRTDHAANLALEFIRTLDDDWPEVPEFCTALGELMIADGPKWVPFSQTHGGAVHIWSTDIDPPARTQRTDPMTSSGTVPFDATFTVPEQCVAIRLRAQLDMTIGANWFISYYYYDYMPLELNLPGVKHINVTCEREPYQSCTRTVVVSGQTDRVTISGQVLDPRWGPIQRARITATGPTGTAETHTDAEGRYSLDLTLSPSFVVATKAAAGTLNTASRQCDFRLNTPAALVVIHYDVRAPGYQPAAGDISLRVPPGIRIVWVHGLIAHRDQISEANARKGTVMPYHRIDKGTVTLRGPKGSKTFEIMFGDFTGYVPVGEQGGELNIRRIILLDPDPNAGTGAVSADPADPENLDGFSQRLKTIWEQAPEDLRKLWLRLGLLIALKKDIEAIATAGYSGSPDNVRQYLERWNNGGYRGRMYNALWTLQESLSLLPDPALSTAADMETHAKNAQSLYARLKGETLSPQAGGGPLKALVQKIIAEQEVGLGW